MPVHQRPGVIGAARAKPRNQRAEKNLNEDHDDGDARETAQRHGIGRRGKF